MKIAFLTSGGNAPCLNSSIGRLLSNFGKIDQDVCAIGYLNGFAGLLKGNSVSLPTELNSEDVAPFYSCGGSFIGNSRVKLTNISDCVKKGLIENGEIPLEMAAKQLIKDKIDILFTIGGDDTNTTARDLQDYIHSQNIEITVVGIPKTIDNDIYPIRRSLGAYTAASAGAMFFENIVSENYMGESHLIIHEVMGRNSGWLTAYTAQEYYKNLDKKSFPLAETMDRRRYDLHGIYVPERKIDIDKEISRLSNIVDQVHCINLFVCEGAFLDEISEEASNNGHSIETDAFGHAKLDSVNAAKWFSSRISKKIDFDRVLIQKSGYYSRSVAPNSEDLEYIFKVCDFAFDSALKFKSGVAGEDERTGKLSCINFDLIRGDKCLDTSSKWFSELIDRVES